MNWGDFKKIFQDPNFRFVEHGHKYFYGEQQLKSCSSLLKPYFPFDEKAIATKYAEKNNMTVQEVLDLWKHNREEGTRIHNVIEKWLNKEKLTQKELIEIGHAQSFMEDKCFTHYIAEVPIWSTSLGVAGTCDLLARDQQGHWHLVDWKTCNRISKWGDPCPGIFQELNQGNYDKYVMQLNIYRFLLENEFKIKIKSMTILHLKKDRSFKAYKCEDREDLVEALFFA